LTEVLECFGVSAPDQWTLYSGVDKVSAVNSPDDDITSMIIDAQSGEIEQYTLTPSAIPVGSTINSVSVRFRYSSFSPTLGLRQGLELSGNTSESADIITTGSATWETEVNALPRPGGGAWSQADIASLEVYAKRTTGIYANAWISTIQVIIDYTPPAATTGDMLLVF